MVGTSKKVIFLDAVANSRKPGESGLSDLTWRLAFELTRLGSEVSVLGLYEEGTTPPYPNVDFMKIKPPRILRQNILTILCERAILAWEAKQCQNENTVFHVSDTLSAGFLAILGLGHRTVWQGHTNVNHNSRLGNPWDRCTYLALLLFSKIAARSVRYVIAFGPSLVPWWKKTGFKPDSIKVIPNGIDPENNNSGIEKINLPSGWLDRENRILYVGRLAKDKGGYFELLTCLQNLNRLHTPSALLFVGDGPFKKKIELFAESMNNHNSVFFLGYQPKEVLHSLYPRADLMILPSLNEMLPRVMLEAWAFGVAFMATDVGAIGDYLIDQYNGYLLNNLDQGYFERRVGFALRDQQKRKSIVENGKREVNKFCWSTIAKKYQYLYNFI